MGLQWSEGFKVTAAACSQGRWCVVMAATRLYTRQVVETDFQYPSEAIHLRWDAGEPLQPPSPPPAGPPRRHPSPALARPLLPAHQRLSVTVSHGMTPTVPRSYTGVLSRPPAPTVNVSS